MSEDARAPLSPEQVERALQATLRDLRESVEHTEDAAVEAANAEHAYKVGYAKARTTYRVMHPKATTSAIDDLALEDVAAEHLAHLLAAQKLTARREANRSLQARLDGLRTLASNLRLNT